MSKLNEPALPNYAKPVRGNQAGAYVNREQDLVRESFQPGNYRSIANLPTEFRAGYVIESIANHIDSNITSAIYHAPHGSYKTYGKHNIFQEFKYIPSNYNLADELKSKEKKLATEKQQSMGKKVFTSASGDASLPKYEYEEEKKYSDPYSAAQDAKRRERWLQQSKVLAGPFLPNTDKTLQSTHGNEALMPNMMRSLATLIDKDWDDSEFQLYRDEEDLIILEFEVSSIESLKGLLAYMNNIITRNAEISAYALSKISELWNHKTGDGSIFYALKPSWVKREVTESYFTLHPERRKFATLRKFMQEQRIQKREEAADVGKE